MFIIINISLSLPKNFKNFMPKFYFITIFSILSSFLLTLSLSSPDTHLDNKRELGYNFYGSKYGSPLFPITNYGNDFYVVTVPISMGNPHVPLILMPYSSQSWFSAIKSLPLDRIMLQCDPKSKEGKSEFVSFTGTGRFCQHLNEINQDQTLVYNYLYVFLTDYEPKSLTAGGLGLGITKDSFPISLTSKVDYKHSIYLSQNQEAYSHILFGGQDPRFYTGNVLATLKSTDVSTWTFKASDIQIVNTGNSKKSIEFVNDIILDPNFPNIHFPKDQMTSVADSLSGHIGGECHYNNIAKMISCDCSKIKNLKSLEFSIGGTTLTLPANMLVTNKDGLCLVKISGTSEKEISYPQVLHNFADKIIFGAAFMTYYYTVFSYSENLKEGSLSLYQAVPHGKRPEFDADVMQNHSKNLDWLKDVAIGFAFIIFMWGLYNFVDFVLKRVKKAEELKPRNIMNIDTSRTASGDQPASRRDEKLSNDSFHFEEEEEDEEEF